VAGPHQKGSIDMVDTVRIVGTRRTEFGKGAARRARAAGQVPAVLYGHHSEVQHFTLPAKEFARAVKGDANRVLTIELDGEEQLALPRAIVRHPVKDYFQHVDLLIIKRGEKVTVDVPVHLVGEAAPGTLVLHETMQLSIEVDALAIPERLEVDITGLQAGTVVHAPAVVLPEGATLVTDAETVILAVQEPVAEIEVGEEATAEPAAAPAAPAED
jgi:large subunit ribosomal protein L25